MGLIGYFSLDPNKVIDLVLHCFERNGHETRIYDLKEVLSQFNTTSVCDILGFHFKHFATGDSIAPRLSQKNGFLKKSAGKNNPFNGILSKISGPQDKMEMQM